MKEQKSNKKKMIKSQYEMIRRFDEILTIGLHFKFLQNVSVANSMQQIKRENVLESFTWETMQTMFSLIDLLSSVKKKWYMIDAKSHLLEFIKNI